MTEDNRDFWFHAKRFGWGWWLPATWQGWMVFAVYAALVLGVLLFVSISHYRVASMIIITILLVIVVIVKGERPLRWRWGKE
jgi:hypothetical protein